MHTSASIFIVVYTSPDCMSEQGIVGNMQVPLADNGKMATAPHMHAFRRACALHNNLSDPPH